MTRKSKIRFEWDARREGLLLAIRDKGTITMPELLDALREEGYAGYMFTIIFNVHEDAGYVGWGDYDEPEGDTWKLWQVVDGDPCPICEQISPPQFCPQCGAHVFPLTELGSDEKIECAICGEPYSSDDLKELTDMGEHYHQEEGCFLCPDCWDSFQRMDPEEQAKIAIVNGWKEALPHGRDD